MNEPIRPIDAAEDDARAFVHRLEARIRGYAAPEAIVAFSGGVDSATVLALSARVLGSSAVTAVTAISPSYPEGELALARQVAHSLRVEHRSIATRELALDAYARNDPMRCFHCKTVLYATLQRLVAKLGPENPRAVILAGTNLDDATEFRPGRRAGYRFSVRNPLLEEGVGKDGVRMIARYLGLAVAEKAALACLSSRVAYGIRLTPALLTRIDRAEQEVRALGYPGVRVRHFGDRAVVEVQREDVARLTGDPRLGWLTDRLLELGWADVSIDPLGYRPGRMNDLLPPEYAAR